MIFGIISCFIIVAVLIIVMVRGFNYNHRIGEGMFKNSEYNLDEADDFVDKNYYDKNAFNNTFGFGKKDDK